VNILYNVNIIEIYGGYLMKKIFSLLLCGIMILGLVGCGNNENENLKNESIALNSEESAKLKINEEDNEKQEKESKEEENKEIKKEAENKEAEESKIKYAKLINDLETFMPEITITAVRDTQDARVMSINIDLLSNIDDTINKCTELAVKKETVMKNEGIEKLFILVHNGDKSPGIVWFELRNGSYELTLNTLRLE